MHTRIHTEFQAGEKTEPFFSTTNIDIRFNPFHTKPKNMNALLDEQKIFHFVLSFYLSIFYYYSRCMWLISYSHVAQSYRHHYYEQ